MVLLHLILSALFLTLVVGVTGKVNLPENVQTCLKETNLTEEDISKTMFFNPNATMSSAAKCFAACLISIDYNVSAASDGILEKESVFLASIMKDSSISRDNATKVVESCRSVVTKEGNRCDNIMNYATCINEKNAELKGDDKLKQGFAILGQQDLNTTKSG
uniref:Odorant binding protein 10 n=1 Tax=Cyrtorhinus lividipennis TaxID=1032904 RepID=A0A1W6AWJ6_9HEMI|nr:odorant binding protein 10 [Cyrtorhinus lividipennis]